MPRVKLQPRRAYREPSSSLTVGSAASQAQIAIELQLEVAGSHELGLLTALPVRAQGLGLRSSLFLYPFPSL
jgi:protein-arginine kinase